MNRLRLRVLVTLGWWAAWCALARGELTLSVEVDGRPLAIAAVERGRILLSDGTRKREAPEDAVWKITGDLRENAEWVRWSPNYGIEVVEKPDFERATMERPLKARVSVNHATELYGQKQKSSPFLLDWPEGVPESGIAVFVWIVDRQIGKAAARPLPSTQRSKYFSSSHAFELTPAEAAGQPAVLLWIDGKFRVPVPGFSDPQTQRAAAAIMLGDEAGLRAALQGGAKPRAVSRMGMTLLALAAEAGNVGAVDLLLAAGARVNEGIDGRNSALVSAVRNGRLAVVERLIAAKANLDPGGIRSAIPLHAALHARHEQVALRLIAGKASLDTREEGHHTPTSLAIEQGLPEAARAILAKEKRFDFKNDQVPRALISQAKLGHTGIVQLLVEKKVKADVEYRGTTALIAAAQSGDPELARTLLAAGVKADQVTVPGGTALMSAAASGKVEFARVLLEAGANPDASMKDGRTVLHHAVSSGNAELVKLLLAKGAIATTREAKGIAPLDMAIATHAREIARLLAEKGAKLDWSRPGGRGFLEQAIVQDLAPVVRAALADGWSPEANAGDPWTPLRIAEICGAAATVDVLRAAGAKAPVGEALPVVDLRELDARPKLKAIRTPIDPRDIDDVFPVTTVEVDVVLDTDGRVRFQRLHRSPNTMLGLVTLDAVSDWRFLPPLRKGLPVATKFRLPVEFASSRNRALETEEVDVLPVPVKQMAPRFPQHLARDGQVGEVRLRFVVNAEGKTEHVRVVSSPHPDFEDEAVSALKTWIFKPGLRDGKPVSVRLEVPIVFSP